jgi:ABC-type transport system involved in multi-copper enzyme maturation permease subunit
LPPLLRDLGLWFWRLGPGNPILVRVVFAGGKRLRHLWIRTGYLAVLTVAVIVGVLIAQSQAGGGASLAALAKSATRVFEYISIVQMGMVCVLAPVFAAGAITQERDAQTYHILLATPLSNAQIVLGSLLSRLYFVIVLLLASVPLFCIMMVWGGVTGREIILTLALCVATATVTASVAIAVSVMKVGTGRTIFSFYLAIGLYLMGVWAAARLPALIPSESEPAPGQIDRMSWLAAFHPFLALWVVLNKTPAPDPSTTAHYGFPWAQWLAYPHGSFIVMSLLISVALVCVSMLFVRRGAKVGEQTLLGRLFRTERYRGADSELSRKPRHVWSNPVAWREAVTRAAAGSGGRMRLALIAAGGLAAVMLLVAYWKGLPAGAVRLWLKGLVGVELGLALFIVTATAATSMTREKEEQTLDLLLTTPLESRHLIGGKIRGLVAFALPMLFLPAASILLFVLFDLFSGRGSRAPGPVVHAENLLTLPVVMVAFTAFASMIGLRMSIHQRRTVVAVLLSVAVVLCVFAITASCAFSARGAQAAVVSGVLSPLSPLSAVMMAIDPAGFVTVGLPGTTNVDVSFLRLVAALSAAIAALVYGLIGWWIYQDLIRNFDMVIRKQSS